ncbi:MAG: hypothetical protein ACLT98_11590 [Eggerthellaceae bacterium]
MPLRPMETGARVVDPEACIGCGVPRSVLWNMPVVDTETGVSTKCIACGRCACGLNGAIEFVDWKDIAQEAINKGIVRTTTLVEN